MLPTVSQLVNAVRLSKLADDVSLHRGAAYAREGKVRVVEASDARVLAVVQGSHAYEVTLAVVKGELAGRCTCPMGLRGVFCKHCAAVAIHVAEDLAQDETPLPSEHFVTDAEVKAFVVAHGIGHVESLGASVLMDVFPAREQSSLRYVLGRQRLMDFASERSVHRFAYALVHAPRLREQVPAAAWKFLHREADALDAAKREVPARLTPPSAPEVLGLFQAVLAFRNQHPEVLPPRTEAVLRAEHLWPATTYPGFRWEHDRPHMGERLTVPVLPIVDLQVSESRVTALCSAGCLPKCEHSLAAVDAVLLWLHEPLDDTRARLVAELRKPAWERALAALDAALRLGDRVHSGEHITFRLEVMGTQILVQPHVHRISKKGTPTLGTAVPWAKLASTYAGILSAEDRKVAAVPNRGYGHADRPLLMALTGHPRVFLRQEPRERVSVESARVGLLADQRDTSVVLVAALDGTRLPDDTLASLRRGGDPSPTFLWEESARRLTVLELPIEVAQTLDALALYGNDFPPESHAALVEKLSALSARVPVAMPRTVMGEAIPPQTHAVLRLEIQLDGSVTTELRMRPLPESATFTPGEGARDVHVRREGKPFHARRDFLSELSAAAAWLVRLPFTPEERAVPSELPFSATLGGAQRALEFLSHLEADSQGSPELEWRGAALRVTARAEATALKVSLERRRDWFGLSGGLAIEGERVSLAVMLDAARRKERFVALDGERFVEINDVLRKHLERLSDFTYAGKHGLEIGPAAVDVLRGLGNEGAKVDADAAWRKLAERIFLAKELVPRVPAALKAELRDYQLEGYRWMSRLASWGAGAVLADDMGLGKTVQTLAVLLDRAKAGPQLVVAPTSVGFNWIDEAKKFAPSLRFTLFAECVDRGATLERLKAKDVLVVSYGMMARDTVRFSALEFATIVFDEAQAIKNAATHRARAARELRGDFKVALSGTPLENHLGELWSLYRTVFPGLLGSWDAFRDRFAIPIEKKLDPTAAPALSRVLRPFLLRRTKAQVAQELPARTEMRVPVVLSPEEWQMYEDARLAALSELETRSSKLKEQERRVQVLAALTRLRLMASHPRLYDARSKVESSKLKRLLELVDELRAEGHRALIFSQFTSHLALVREALDARGVSYLYLDGSTPQRERKVRVQAFQEGDAPLFLISLKAGGFGLNLTGADNVIHLDPWWNPAVEDQASDRAHRIGQHRPVTIYRLISKGTIEEQILALHEDKRAVIEGVLEGKDQAGRLSTRELVSLLSAPAASDTDIPQSVH